MRSDGRRRPKTDEVNWTELKPQLIKMALELGPLVVFFIVNARADIFTGTAWFMGAMVIVAGAQLAAAQAHRA